MKHTTLMLCGLLALGACSQDAPAEKDSQEAQLEEVAENLDPAATAASPTASSSSASPSSNDPLFNLTLQKGQAGAVKIGMPIEEMKQAYGQNKLREIKLEQEGMATTAYEVLGERRRPDLLVEQECTGQTCKVSRITVLNPAFKTQNDIGIGSMFSQVKENFTISRVSPAEGKFVAISEKDRISFLLDMEGIPEDRWAKIEVRDIPNLTLVSGVMLF